MRLISCLVLLSASLVVVPARAEPSSCPLPPLPAGEDLARAALDPDKLTLTADQAEMQDDGWSRLRGAVRLLQGERLLSAEQLDYDKRTRKVSVRQPSVYRDRNVFIRSRSLEFDLAASTGSFLGTDYQLTRNAGRGAATRLSLTGPGQVEAAGASYTTCSPDSEFWTLRAGAIEIDQTAGVGVARHARIEFGGVPLLYTPYLRFPTDDRRRSGLLTPTIGESARTGFDYSWPLYLNLAENYDATLTPRYMSERGAQINAAGRYLFERSTGAINLEYLPEDTRTETARTLFEIQHRALLGEQLALEGRYAEVSDTRYFEDLGSRLEASSVTHLDRHVLITLGDGAFYNLSVLLQDYQTISASVLADDEPYKRIPQVRLNLLTRDSWFDLRAGLDAEYAFFFREQETPLQPKAAQRVDLTPYLRWQQDRATWYALSQLDFRGTLYQIPDDPQGGRQFRERALPIFSAEGGLRFERFTDAGDVQTLEPKLFYLYVPFREQQSLPLLDSGVPDFDFVQLFSRSNFTGEDRIGDANHIALSVSSRLLEPATGDVRLNASLGQIYRLEPTRSPPPCARPPCTAPDEGPTDFIAAADYQLTPAWQLGGDLQWSPDDGLFKRNSLALKYREGDWRADVAYRFRERLLQQADVSMQLPVPFTEHWNFTGRIRYSLPDQQTQEALAGLGYESCCWSARVLGRRFLVNTQGEFTNGVYFQFELKGLASLGNKLTSLLPQY